MKRFWFRRAFGELRLPRRFQIDGIRQNQASTFVDSVRWNQVADALARLVFNPVIDVLAFPLGIVSEIERLQSRAIKLCDQGTKRFAKVITFLREEPVCDRQRDGFARAAELV